MGMQGPIGNWVSCKGRKDSKFRNMRWRLAGVDSCSGGQVIQDQKRKGIFGCGKSGAYQPSGSVWGGNQDTEVDRKRSMNQLNGGAGCR